MFYVRTPRGEFLLSLRPVDRDGVLSDPITIDHAAPRVTWREAFPVAGALSLFIAAGAGVVAGLLSYACL